MAHGTELRREVADRLSMTPRRLPSSLHYDAEGSRLFDEIIKQPEYYVTRTETALLSAHAGEILGSIPSFASATGAVVELGASDANKAAFLFDAMPDRISSYVPINIDPTVLDAIVHDLRRARPTLQVAAVEGDFTSEIALPPLPDIDLPIVFFPGGTMSQLDRRTLVELFARVRRAMEPWKHAAFIVGADVCRDRSRLLPAYDDQAGANAAFNRNLLSCLNRLGDGTFDPTGFVHAVVWNEAESRIEFYLESVREQEVRFAGREFRFVAGERIGTGYSYKRTHAEFRSIAVEGGWSCRRFWTDPEHLFEIHLLLNDSPKDICHA